MRYEVKNPEIVARRLLYLAWKASYIMGMGAFQDNPNATEEEVWQRKTDNPFGGGGTGKVTSDYLFGRIMKLRFEYDETSVTLPDTVPSPDYQGWSLKYRTYDELMTATMASLGAGEQF